MANIRFPLTEKTVLDKETIERLRAEGIAFMKKIKEVSKNAANSKLFFGVIK